MSTSGLKIKRSYGSEQIRSVYLHQAPVFSRVAISNLNLNTISSLADKLSDYYDVLTRTLNQTSLRNPVQNANITTGIETRHFTDSFSLNLHFITILGPD